MVTANFKVVPDTPQTVSCGKVHFRRTSPRSSESSYGEYDYSRRTREQIARFLSLSHCVRVTSLLMMVRTTMFF